MELMRSVNARPPRKCPDCGATGTLTKRVSAPAFQFKGTGWYVTDYADKKGSSGKDEKGESSSSASESKTDSSDSSSSKTESKSKGSDKKKSSSKSKE